MSNKKILMVVSNASKLDQMTPTGVWLEEFAIPYTVFKETGYDITIASPNGGNAPVDKESIDTFKPNKWNFAFDLLAKTKPLDEIRYKDFDAIVIPGGHGPMIDLVKNSTLINILKYFDANNLLIGAICHGPAALINVVQDGGIPLVANRKITAFSNEEEKLANKDKIVPFSLEDKLIKMGANYVKKLPNHAHVITDGNLITAQNYQSSMFFARTILKLL